MDKETFRKKLAGVDKQLKKLELKVTFYNQTHAASLQFMLFGRVKRDLIAAHAILKRRTWLRLTELEWHGTGRFSPQGHFYVTPA